VAPTKFVKLRMLVNTALSGDLGLLITVGWRWPRIRMIRSRPVTMSAA
jgi:hypothetical protein